MEWSSGGAPKKGAAFFLADCAVHGAVVEAAPVERGFSRATRVKIYILFDAYII